MQSAHLELNRQPVRLDSIVEEAVALIQPSITAREQTVELDIDSTLHPLMIDEQRIERVISNLISNAHKYSPKGGLIRIEIRREQEDQVIRVVDEGPGINEDELEAVFSPYYRGKLADTSPVQGSGLGLSIARYLTELHEGTLSVASGVEKGSIFELKLPASSLDLLDDDSPDASANGTDIDDGSLWPQAIGTPSDKAFTQ
jgi:signal transduction histidine kinase